MGMCAHRWFSRHCAAGYQDALISMCHVGVSGTLTGEGLHETSRTGFVTILVDPRKNERQGKT